MLIILWRITVSVASCLSVFISTNAQNGHLVFSVINQLIGNYSVADFILSFPDTNKTSCLHCKTIIHLYWGRSASQYLNNKSWIVVLTLPSSERLTKLLLCSQQLSVISQHISSFYVDPRTICLILELLWGQSVLRNITASPGLTSEDWCGLWMRSEGHTDVYRHQGSHFHWNKEGRSPSLFKKIPLFCPTFTLTYFNLLSTTS